MSFKGFSPETVDFLWGIRMNNNREWFTEHKPAYVQYLYEPMKDLGKDLYAILEDRPGNLLKVSRIYRDARMHHPLPYKESLWICIRKDVEWWAEHPCLYFEITPDGVSYGLIWWQPKVEALRAFRQGISADSKAFLKILRKLKRDTGLEVTANTYKRPPQVPEDEKLLPYFAWKGCIACSVDEAFSEQTFGPEFGNRVAEALKAMLPLYEYLYKFSL